MMEHNFTSTVLIMFSSFWPVLIPLVALFALSKGLLFLLRAFGNNSRQNHNDEEVVDLLLLEKNREEADLTRAVFVSPTVDKKEGAKTGEKIDVDGVCPQKNNIDYII